SQVRKLPDDIGSLSPPCSLCCASYKQERRGPFPMSEAPALFAVLRDSADSDTTAALERLIQDGSDRELNRINALEFAARVGLDEERVISAFLHAARLGLFELSWNVLCPGCGGVLNANATLKAVDRDEYSCALCAA